MNDKSLSDQNAISNMPNLQMNENNNNRITVSHLNDFILALAVKHFIFDEIVTKNMNE